MPAATALPACNDLIDGAKVAGADLSAALFVRSQIWRGRNDADRQLSDLNDAIRIDPRNALALAARGNARRSQKSYDLARTDLDAAVAAGPANAETWFQRAFLEREQGDSVRALSDYTQSLKL